MFHSVVETIVQHCSLVIVFWFGNCLLYFESIVLHCTSFGDRNTKKQPVCQKTVCLRRARRPIRPALNSGFCSIKQLGILLLPPGWDASPSQGYPAEL